MQHIEYIDIDESKLKEVKIELERRVKESGIASIKNVMGQILHPRIVSRGAIELMFEAMTREGKYALHPQTDTTDIFIQLTRGYKEDHWLNKNPWRQIIATAIISAIISTIFTKWADNINLFNKKNQPKLEKSHEKTLPKQENNLKPKQPVPTSQKEQL